MRTIRFSYDEVHPDGEASRDGDPDDSGYFVPNWGKFAGHEEPWPVAHEIEVYTKASDGSPIYQCCEVCHDELDTGTVYFDTNGDFSACIACALKAFAEYVAELITETCGAIDSVSNASFYPADSDKDFRTGISTSYHAHLEGFTAVELDAIEKAVSAWRYAHR